MTSATALRSPRHGGNPMQDPVEQRTTETVRTTDMSATPRPPAADLHVVQANPLAQALTQRPLRLTDQYQSDHQSGQDHHGTKRPLLPCQLSTSLGSRSSTATSLPLTLVSHYTLSFRAAPQGFARRNLKLPRLLDHLPFPARPQEAVRRACSTSGRSSVDVRAGGSTRGAGGPGCCPLNITTFKLAPADRRRHR